MHLRFGTGFLLISITIIAYDPADAAQKVDVRKRYAEGMERYSSWRQRRDAGEEVTQPSPDEMLGLQAGEHLKDKTLITTDTGTTKEKLAETYQNLPVFGQSVVIETDQGEPTGNISGHLIEGIHDDIPDTHPALSEEEALSLAAASIGDNVQDISDDGVQIILEIYVEEQESSTEVLTFLTYSISYFIVRDGTPSRPKFIMEANTGEIFRAWEGLPTRPLRRQAPDTDDEQFSFSVDGGNLKVGRYTYGDQFPALQLRYEGDTCYLENDRVKVVDDRLNTDEAFSFPCEHGFNDSINGAYSPMADGFFFGSMTYDLFVEWLGVEPLPYKVIIVVHYSEMGDGMTANAFWNNGATLFGDGNDMIYPLTVLDVLGHEVAHGFTEHNSNLIYTGESGGMNEAFSDMAGAAAEEYMKQADWLNGNSALKHGEALRYFADPTQDGISIAHAAHFCPDMNVHFSSGIYNKVFYLLSTTEGWNIRMAFQAFATANLLYWSPGSSFKSGACGVWQAAEDLGFNVQDVTAAFQVVGISTCDDEELHGLDLISKIHAVANETLTFTFLLQEEHLEMARIETYYQGLYMGFTPPFNIHIQTPERNLSSESMANMYVLNPPPGVYIVSLVAKMSSFASSLYFITGRSVLVDNIVFDSGEHTATGSFYLPTEVVQAGQPVLIRTDYSVGTEQVEQEVIGPLPFTIIYDNDGMPDNEGPQKACFMLNEKNLVYETIIRNPQPGQYNYEIESASPYLLTIEPGIMLLAETILLPQ